MDASPLFESKLTGLELVHRGKVRDNYAVDDGRLLIVATDRLSAFDVVMQDPIPGKGRVLTAISDFWFGRTQRIVSNHLTGEPLSRYVGNPGELAMLEGRAVIVERLTPLPVEAVVRGYLAGSGWKDYQKSGTVCGIELPEGLAQAARLPEPIFTPATKAPAGAHDENIGYDSLVAIIGASAAARIRELSLKLYAHAVDHALTHGIIIADTKFEFGLDHKNRVVLMDEVLTPDSSRFWPVDSYEVGTSPPSFDKQYVRDYLESLGWDKQPPAPKLPPDVIRLTAQKYREAQHRLMA
ncbi:MAG: phosphoribosylaminoimidazole-succinocarboxamide synthase [Steroidobacteraceae bacterium]|nr:phosphoribosylaminoimidazole-succinocarboxamide synthase [Steroidobacteraceae bacterium]MBM2854295.1 phosphoribosylaminoimidazole-succinocarboxamide synthase [Steroidobacteraceae bacterium]